MGVSVGIIDYQMGNLRSVAKAIEKVGGTSIVSSSPSELEKATHLILPGVGAFGDAMRELSERNLIPWIRDWVSSDRPFLGICLGMQLLFDSSEEGGTHQGLSILLARSSNLQRSIARYGAPKNPSYGWNQVTSTIDPDPMLEGIPSNPYVYFVHSYYVVPADPAVTWLTCDYGQNFCAAVRRNKMLATQFHPEKSQADGLRLLGNFLRLDA